MSNHAAFCSIIETKVDDSPISLKRKKKKSPLGVGGGGAADCGISSSQSGPSAAAVAVTLEPADVTKENKGAGTRC